MADKLYIYPYSRRRKIESRHGIYFISDMQRIYCGVTANLSARPNQSSRKQHIYGDILVYPTGIRQSKHLERPADYELSLESSCISALHTIIYGNGLPIELVNKEHRKWMASTAWEDERAIARHGRHQGESLAIILSQMALIHFGIPHPLVSFPSKDSFGSKIPNLLYRYNMKNWRNLIIEYSKENKHLSTPEHLRGLTYVA